MAQRFLAPLPLDDKSVAMKRHKDFFSLCHQRGMTIVPTHTASLCCLPLFPSISPLSSRAASSAGSSVFATGPVLKRAIQHKT
jgi:hypothetical protein